MKTTFILSLLFALTALAASDKVNFDEATTSESPKNEVAEKEAGASDDDGDVSLNAKAASRQVNCACQCSSISFLDKYGQINGNCRTADRTGARWCYVDPRYARCADLQRSVRFNSLWSYEACATPELYSRQCGGYVPAAGNGFGSDAVPAGLPNLAPGPEGFPFSQHGGYPGLNGGTGSLGLPVSGSGSGYPAGYPSLSGILDIAKKNTEKKETEGGLVFSE